MKGSHHELRMLERCEAYLDSYFVEGHQPVKKKARVVTISRQAYSQVHEIAEELIDLIEADAAFGKERWAIFDKKLVFQVLESQHLPKELSKYMPEDKEHHLTSHLNEILGLHPSLWELFHHTCDTILKLASRGNVILVGRGAHILTRHFEQAVHARVVAPLEKRTGRAARLNAIGEKEARHLIRKEDHGRAAFIHSHFNESIDDPLSYDIVLNTGRLSAKDAAALIHDLLRRRI